MYRSILRAIEQQEQIQDVEHYLQSLKPYVINLRRGFRNSLIRVDYSDFKVQAAYLLAYYPLYSEVTYRVLMDLAEPIHQAFAQKKRLQACFLGGGPTPEAVALSTYLKQSGSQVNSLTAYAFDIAATTWSKSQEVSKYLVSKANSEIQFSLQGHPLNLCQKNVFSTYRDIIQTTDLFVIQNCLNEFVNTPQVFIENIDFLIQEMSESSILIIADLNFEIVKRLMGQVECHFRTVSRLEVIRSNASGYSCLHSRLPLLKVLTDNLLTGEEDLIPKKKVNFNYLAIQKMPIAVQFEYASIPF
ncbi:MAG: hypothetical protein MUC48_08995 [Leptolyngbya sp. Prado105]|nr:hypothetical protein [Leptolyngbya sp. Prado105]